MSVEVKTIRSDIPGHQPHFSTTSLAQDEGRKLFVGRDISLTGEIHACDHLIVEGTVNAELRGSRRMDVLENGLFRGVAEVQEATVAGRFEGDLIVLGRLSIRSTAVITGNICYGMLEVSAGAQVRGGIEALAQQQPVHYHQNETAETANTAEVPEQRNAKVERFDRLKGQPEARAEIRAGKKAA